MNVAEIMAENLRPYVKTYGCALIATMAGVGEQTVRNVVHGRYTTMRNAEAIAGALGLNLVHLLTVKR